MSCCFSRYYCIVNNHVIVAFINSSLYSCEMYKQVKEMVTLHLFIAHHYKYIVLSIRERHILTLHLSTANWRIKLTTGCCCNNVASCYAISFCLVESIPQFLELWPIPMRVQGTSNFTLLYRNATTYGIILPCLKLKYFNLPNHVLYLNVTRVKFRITLKVRSIFHIVHVSQVRTICKRLCISTNSPILHCTTCTHEMSLYSIHFLDGV